MNGTLLVGAAVAAGLLVVSAASASRAGETGCSPGSTSIESPRPSSREVQAKAINDRGDIVGFADAEHGKSPVHAILWRGGRVARATDLGVLPGYVASEAYGVNNKRVVFGLLYDRKQRVVPFRWANDRMTVLKGPSGQTVYTENPGQWGRNAVNSRGEMTWTVIVGVNRRAIRWAPDGKATFLPGLPGHAWTDALSINDNGVVSGWSRQVSTVHGKEIPVIWDASGRVVALKTARARAGGVAEATSRSGVTVGFLGNFGADDTDAAAWLSRTASPRLLGRRAPSRAAELADVNEHGQAAGVSGTLGKDGFELAEPRIWRTGWTSLKPIRIPLPLQTSPVTFTAVNDINNRGDIVGTVYGLARKDFSSVLRIDPVLWTCQFGS